VDERLHIATRIAYEPWSGSSDALA
jgi:hypothetical protein